MPHLPSEEKKYSKVTITVEDDDMVKTMVVYRAKDVNFNVIAKTPDRHPAAGMEDHFVSSTWTNVDGFSVFITGMEKVDEKYGHFDQRPIQKGVTDV